MSVYNVATECDLTLRYCTFANRPIRLYSSKTAQAGTRLWQKYKRTVS